MDKMTYEEFVDWVWVMWPDSGQVSAREGALTAFRQLRSVHETELAEMKSQLEAVLEKQNRSDFLLSAGRVGKL